MPALDNAADSCQPLGYVSRGVGLGQRDSILLTQFVSEREFDLFTENRTTTREMKESFLGNKPERWNFHLAVNDEKENVHGVL
jgi:hypothetical protein